MASVDEVDAEITSSTNGSKQPGGAKAAFEMDDVEAGLEEEEDEEEGEEEKEGYDMETDLSEDEEGPSSWLLHGRLEIFIEKARGLRHRNASCSSFLSLESSCVVVVGKSRIARTKVTKRTRNPNWQESFSVDVCHESKSISFRVIDESHGFLGQVSFSVSEMMQQGKGITNVYGEYPLSRSKRHMETVEDNAATWGEKKRAKKSRRRKSKIGWLTLRFRFTPANTLVTRQNKMYKTKLRRAGTSSAKVKRCVEQMHPRVVPGTYFRAHKGDHFILYQSAHQPGMAAVLPEIALEGPSDVQKVNKKTAVALEEDDGQDEDEDLEPGVTYKARSCWADLFHALNDAEQFICLSAYQLDPDTRLIRSGPDWETQPTIGQLLLRKAREGVLVFVMVWDSASEHDPFASHQAQHETKEERKQVEGDEKKDVVRDPFTYFKGSNVLCVRVQRQKKKGEDVGMARAFAHHQNAVVMDIKPVDAAKLQIRHRRHENTKIQAVTAFLGSLEFARGRFDDPDKTLFASLKRLHKDDFYQPCLPFVNAQLGPRLPWQDAFVRVSGMAAVDVLKNFIERWHRQVGWHRYAAKSILCLDPATAFYGWQMKKLLKLLRKSPGKAALPQSFLDETKDQIVGHAETVLRLNDGANVFREQDEEDDEDNDLSELSDDELQDLQQDLDELVAEERARSGSWNADFSTDSKVNAEKVVQIFRSVDEDIARLDRRIIAPKVTFDRDLKVDASLHKAYVHHIRHAKHFVYLETEFFLGSCHFWTQARNCGANNLVPAEIAAKICEKIAARQPFHAYVVVPLFPKGVPSAADVQQLLWWQRHTVQAVYKRIALAIKAAGLQDTRKPTDYFSLHFLGNREAGEEHKRFHDLEQMNQDENAERLHDEQEEDPNRATYKRVLASRRFMVYVHSNVMIVDDEVALVGSGSVNQRSLAGDRDSELAVAVFEANRLATDTTTPRGVVYGYRMTLWSEHLGPSLVDSPDFDAALLLAPQSEECVGKVQELAHQNWLTFVAPGEAQNVQGHLMRYPYHIGDDGTVSAVAGHENFPDFVDASVLGSSATVPNLLSL